VLLIQSGAMTFSLCCFTPKDKHLLCAPTSCEKNHRAADEMFSFPRNGPKWLRDIIMGLGDDTNAAFMEPELTQEPFPRKHIAMGIEPL
jgi:hypothetical protein